MRTKKVGSPCEVFSVVSGKAAQILRRIATDLSAVGRHDLTDFDPQAVARLETAMWKSYYSHERLRMFGQLAELLRTQYHLSFWTSRVGAYHAARAAVVFQAGHGRQDYERALPGLVLYYRLILKNSSTPFDVEKVAWAELEWWIVHRERARYQPGDLERALAELQASSRRRTGRGSTPS